MGHISAQIGIRLRIGFVLGVGLMVVAGVGVAVAAHTSGPFVSACVRSDQAVRFVASDLGCRTNEERVLLATYPTAAGIGETHVEMTTIDNEIFNALSTRTYAWACVSGTMLNAGATTTELDRLVIAESLPTAAGWRVTFKNTIDGEVGADSVTLSAVCTGPAV